MQNCIAIQNVGLLFEISAVFLTSIGRWKQVQFETNLDYETTCVMKL